MRRFCKNKINPQNRKTDGPETAKPHRFLAKTANRTTPLKPKNRTKNRGKPKNRTEKGRKPQNRKPLTPPPLYNQYLWEFPSNVHWETFTNSLCLYNQYLRGFPSNVYWEISICVLSIITCISEAFFRLYRRISDEKIFFFTIKHTLSRLPLRFGLSPISLGAKNFISRLQTVSAVSHLPLGRCLNFCHLPSPTWEIG